MSEPIVDILWEEGPCLVVNKPPGLSTQAPPGIDSLEVRVRTLLECRAGRETGTGLFRDLPTTAVYLGVPHRLDRPASGALVFATRRKAAQRLSRQFERRQVGKRYWACVAGSIPAESGTWEDYLRKVSDEPRAEIVGPDHPQGRLAVLHYQVLATAAWGSWLEITLQTGRFHQIRLQAASRGFPILGDAQYGSAVPFGPPQDDWRQRPIALHARRLEFLHPISREPVAVTAPVPDFWPEITRDGGGRRGGIVE